MNYTSYTAQVKERLSAHNFIDTAAPADLAGRVGLTMERQENWGRLILALATEAESGEGARREALTGALAAWVKNLRRHEQSPVYLILVFPFDRKVPDETAEAIRSLRREGPEQAWGVIPWTADLDVELLDTHSGFPKIGVEVARALTEVPRNAWESVKRKASGPKIGTRGPLLGNMGYVPATRLILALTIAAYLWVILISGSTMNIIGGADTRTLLDWGANHGRLVLAEREQWRLITHVLLHGGLLHLGLNMWALWQVGRHTEMIYGTGRMSFIYVMAGMAGGIASTALRPNFVPSVGASGAILGLMGALVYFAVAIPGRRVDWRELMGPVGINLVYGFFLRGIDNYAHIGGFIGGFLAAFLAGIPGERAPWRLAAMAAAGAVVGMLLTGLLPLGHFPIGG